MEQIQPSVIVQGPSYEYVPLSSPGYFRLLRVTRRIQDRSALSGRKRSRLLCCLKRTQSRVEDTDRLSFQNWDFSIETRRRSGFSDFEAVSYAWGDLTKTNVLQLKDGRVIPITKSLFEALPYLADRSATGRLWIDQLCINQDDLDERGSQVPTMGEIYSQAVQTFAWTGLADGSSDLVARIPYVDEQQLYNALSAVCLRPWFSRGWVSQEAVL
ncbi:HET-domain-containing protein, partial [Aulographum hederae CBS 113979]